MQVSVPHWMLPPAHEGAQTPLSQTCPVPHARPQAPQFSRSLRRLAIHYRVGRLMQRFFDVVVVMRFDGTGHPNQRRAHVT